ncbi:sensor histidine kinase [Hymenobacter sp. BT683]|uniref:Sensor histidine kinase n=1 Tax=Hymenobacter jeongseonensis TaxID=2791027 RepID=A0ABS0INM7_9BACT|nr:sensor histidine kinase [Hymenobacter jeongseonensis]MBF9239979.1 sensor histidine kinase [Hymenobacter jeongseonensis]
MRKPPWFYLFVFGLALLLAVYTRLTMADRAEDFYLFPDAPFWLFLEALLVVHLLDRLHARATRRGRASEQAAYYFGLLWRGALLFVGLLQLLQVALMLAHVGRGDYGSWYEVVRWLSATLFLYLLAGSVYLPFLYQQHASEVRLALARAEKAVTEARLRALQQHVDPHFLFNNLNILSSLIEPANGAALDYASHLASLYRYLVRAGQRDVVPVAEELAFARDYQFLLQRRFGAAYRFEEDVQLPLAGQAERLLPPGMLQELLTNAVKHNLASRQHPLLIRVTLTPTALRLEHPRRPRPVPAAGTGRGLPGLRARLALLTDQPLVVEDTPTYFAVTVPLLAALPPTPAAHAPAAAGR